MNAPVKEAMRRISDIFAEAVARERARQRYRKEKNDE